MQREAYLNQVQGQKEIIMHYIKPESVKFTDL